MGTPFTFSGTLSYPPDQGVPAVPLPFGANGQFDSGAAGMPLTLTGSGTKDVDLGTIPGAGLKALLIEVDLASPTPGSTPAPIFVRLNGAGAAGQTEISPGGFMALGSPTPAAGITAITIAYASDVRVWIRALG